MSASNPSSSAQSVTPPPTVSTVPCRKCGQPINEGDRICLNCGHDAVIGVNAATQAKLKGAGRFGAAVAVAAVVAFLGALGWGLLGWLTGYEIGWLAWLLGAAVGVAFVVGGGGPRYGLRGGVAAATLAVAGILVGKIMLVSWAAGPVLAKEARKSDEMRQTFFVDWMMESGPDGGAVWIDSQRQAMRDEGKISDALWDWQQKQRAQTDAGADSDDPPAALLRETEAFGQELQRRISALTANPPDEWLEARAKKFLRHIGYMDRLKAALGFMDIFFICLAVYSAFKIGSGAAES